MQEAELAYPKSRAVQSLLKSSPGDPGSWNSSYMTKSYLFQKYYLENDIVYSRTWKC